MTTSTRSRRGGKGASPSPGAEKPAAKKSAQKKPVEPGKGKSEAIDPRLRARRIEVLRGEGRRRLRTLVALVVITLAAIGVLAALDSSFLDVDRLVVNGAVNTAPADIIDQSGIVPGDALVELDLDVAASRIESLPWIESADLDRRWTGDVRIVVTERVAVAALPTRADLTDGPLVLIDRGGRQLELISERPVGFMPILGIEASGRPGEPAPSEARAAVRVFEGLRPEVAEEVEAIALEDGWLVLHLVAGGDVLLGDDSSLEEKLLSFESMLARADLRCLGRIDVRVPDAPALTRVGADGNPSTFVADLASCT